jgi:hypothetical protein
MISKTRGSEFQKAYNPLTLEPSWLPFKNQECLNKAWSYANKWQETQESINNILSNDDTV